jgi:hypothetical protein
VSLCCNMSRDFEPCPLHEGLWSLPSQTTLTFPSTIPLKTVLDGLHRSDAHLARKSAHLGVIIQRAHLACKSGHLGVIIQRAHLARKSAHLGVIILRAH